MTMAEKPEQLEKELSAIWRGAPNTRKRTALRRITIILDRSLAELSLRDLLMFFIYLGQACFMLAAAVIQILFTTSETQRHQQDIEK